MSDLQLDRIVRYGKVTKEFVGRPFKVHFLVYKQDGPYGEKGFGAVALEFGYFSFSENEQEAFDTIIAMVDYLSSMIEDSDEFLYNIEKIHLDEFWELYRKINYLQSENKSSLTK